MARAEADKKLKEEQDRENQKLDELKRKSDERKKQITPLLEKLQSYHDYDEPSYITLYNLKITKERGRDYSSLLIKFDGSGNEYEELNFNDTLFTFRFLFNTEIINNYFEADKLSKTGYSEENHMIKKFMDKHINQLLLERKDKSNAHIMRDGISLSGNGRRGGGILISGKYAELSEETFNDIILLLEEFKTFMEKKANEKYEENE